MSKMTSNGWQPINTAPEEGCWALVCGDGAMDCMFIRKGHVPENWTNPNNPNLSPSEVTHWMPIPEFAPQPSELSRDEQRAEWLREVRECADHVATTDYFEIDAAISRLMSVVERCPKFGEKE